MTDTDPVTQWLNSMNEGSESATASLWKHFFERLVLLAKQRIHDGLRRIYDEEDAAASAFNSFCMGIRKGAFPDLADRKSIWRLLVVITARKVADQERRRYQQKRGSGAVKGESAMFSRSERDDRRTIDQVLSREPTPEFALEFADQCEAMCALLEDDSLAEVVRLKLAGYTDVEIAKRMGCARRTVQRRLDCIRAIWNSEAL